MISRVYQQVWPKKRSSTDISVSFQFSFILIYIQIEIITRDFSNYPAYIVISSHPKHRIAHNSNSPAKTRKLVGRFVNLLVFTQYLYIFGRFDGFQLCDSLWKFQNLWGFFKQNIKAVLCLYPHQFNKSGQIRKKLSLGFKCHSF